MISAHESTRGDASTRDATVVEERNFNPGLLEGLTVVA
jgi:hypothetical protein